MNRIRLATKEEVERIADKSDLDFAQGVFALDGKDGEIELGVYKVVPQIDPVIFSDRSGTQKRLVFLRDLETVLWAQGQRAYYFHAPSEDKDYINILTKLGAEPVHSTPQTYFKKPLNK